MFIFIRFDEKVQERRVKYGAFLVFKEDDAELCAKFLVRKNEL